MGFWHYQHQQKCLIVMDKILEYLESPISIYCVGTLCLYKHLEYAILLKEIEERYGDGDGKITRRNREIGSPLLCGVLFRSIADGFSDDKHPTHHRRRQSERRFRALHLMEK